MNNYWKALNILGQLGIIAAIWWEYAVRWEYPEFFSDPSTWLLLPSILVALASGIYISLRANREIIQRAFMAGFTVECIFIAALAAVFFLAKRGYAIHLNVLVPAVLGCWIALVIIDWNRIQSKLIRP